MSSLIGYDQVWLDSIDKVYDFFYSTIYMMNFHLAPWDVVTPNGDINLSRRWFKWWLLAWRHQAITWTNVDLSSKVFCGMQDQICKECSYVNQQIVVGVYIFKITAT